MDIKTRIDNLTEAEARAALAKFIDIFYMSTSCKFCVRHEKQDDKIIPCGFSGMECKNHWLDEALNRVKYRFEMNERQAQIEYARDLILKLGYDLAWYDLDKMTRGQISRLIDELVEDISNFSPCYDQCGGDCLIG